jgi:phosphoribosylanthranilate isomerase
MRSEDARHAQVLGADFGGTIFTESARRVTTREALEIFEGAPELKRVGVFGRSSVGEVLLTAKAVSLDVIQMHRSVAVDELIHLRDEFDGEIWAVIPVDIETGTLPSDWRTVSDLADALLLDSSVRGVSGGTGRTFNWQQGATEIRALEGDARIIVAGGLDPRNVERAITETSPWAVDVSSGVETSPGRKDHGLMTAFADAVRSASIV